VAPFAPCAFVGLGLKIEDGLAGRFQRAPRTCPRVGLVDPQAGEAWGSTHPPHSLRDERRYKRPRRGLVRIWGELLVQRRKRGKQLWTVRRMYCCVGDSAQHSAQSDASASCAFVTSACSPRFVLFIVVCKHERPRLVRTTAATHPTPLQNEIKSKQSKSRENPRKYRTLRLPVRCKLIKAIGSLLPGGGATLRTRPPRPRMLNSLLGGSDPPPPPRGL
jgi:hypothetical protein